MTLNPPREANGRFEEYSHSSPETALLETSEDDLATAFARNSDIFRQPGMDPRFRYSQPLTVGGRHASASRIQLVFDEVQERFIVNAWNDVPLRPNDYVHASDLRFTDEETRELVLRIETENATAADVDKLAEAFRRG